MAAREAERVIEDQQPYLADLTTWRAWEDWRDVVVDRYRRQGIHCPLGILITELGRSTPAAQALTTQLLEQWQSALRSGVEHMQRAGHISGHLEPGRTAATIVATVQGGVTILMSTGDVTHLEAALDTLLTLLKTSTRTPSDRMSDIAD
ncbi:TetR family transcriptional regulator C-terminal domain-containing protein [Nocardia asiatica]|uniref:TetR family transcriptional regulator C-terminal domain-containing protein n=1 Tax=Nocardia asiatica TaxID=209252 RepID=UPI003EE1C030